VGSGYCPAVPLYEDKLSDSFGVETLAEIGGGAGVRLRMGGEK
jgi:hypothetical protein